MRLKCACEIEGVGIENMIGRAGESKGNVRWKGGTHVSCGMRLTRLLLDRRWDVWVYFVFVRDQSRSKNEGDESDLLLRKGRIVHLIFFPFPQRQEGFCWFCSSQKRFCV